MSETDTRTQLRSWHVECLHAMGFNHHQRLVLLERLDKEELDLAELRKMLGRPGWTPEMVFLAVR